MFFLAHLLKPLLFAINGFDHITEKAIRRSQQVCPYGNCSFVHIRPLSEHVFETAAGGLQVFGCRFLSTFVACMISRSPHEFDGLKNYAFLAYVRRKGALFFFIFRFE